MKIGIIGVFIGVIIYIVAFFMVTNSAVQETVQLLMFINGTIFIIGGFILIGINEIIKSIHSNNQKELLSNIYKLLYKNIEGIELYQNEKNIILENIDETLKANEIFIEFINNENKLEIVYKIFLEKGKSGINNYIKYLINTKNKNNKAKIY
jgi:hypothetical protein